MKTAVVVSLFLYFRISLSQPVSTESVPDRAKNSPQSDSVPIALLLIPPGPQLRDEDPETGVQSDDLTLIEDSIMNLLLRDTEVVNKDGGDQLFVIEEKIFAQDLSPRDVNIQSDELKPNKDFVVSPAQPGDDKNLSILSKGPLPSGDDQPLLSKENDDLSLLPRVNSGEVPVSLLSEENLPSSKNSQPEHLFSTSDSEHKLSSHEEDFKVSFVPQMPLPSSDSLLSLSPREDEEASSLPEINKEDHALERSYADIEYMATYQPTTTTSKPVEQVVATYPQPSESSIPLLLNCVPKVEKGHLSEDAPSHISHSYKASDGQNLDRHTIPDINNSDVIDLNSPSSIITTDRRRRDTGMETGVTHYKVSEDHTDNIKGNHHLVSEDFPEPNIVKFTETSSTSL